jgi:hypothetical protein
MSKYAAVSNKTNTVSTTVPMWNLVGAATRRLKVFELLVGSDATPADQANKFALRRTTADGSPLTDFTPTKLDPADGASIARLDLTWTGAAEPTITGTGASDVLQFAINQRTTFRWLAAPGCELVIPAVAEAGLALMSAISTGVANHAYTVLWSE